MFINLKILYNTKQYIIFNKKLKYLNKKNINLNFYKNLNLLNCYILNKYLINFYVFIYYQAKTHNSFLLISTKQATIKSLIKLTGNLTKNSYINNKWFPGLLTNWEHTKQLIILFKWFLLIYRLILHNKLNLSKSIILKLIILYKKLKNNLLGIQNLKKKPTFVIFTNILKETQSFKEVQLLNLLYLNLIPFQNEQNISEFFELLIKTSVYNNIKLSTLMLQLLITAWLQNIFLTKNVYINKYVL